MNEINAVPLLIQENHPIVRPALSENEDSAVIPGAPVPSREAAAPTGVPDGHEPYERGMALKNASLFRQAAEHFGKAAQDPAYTLKGFAQMGLVSGKVENRKRPRRLFGARYTYLQYRQKNKCRSSTSWGKR